VLKILREIRGNHRLIFLRGRELGERIISPTFVQNPTTMKLLRTLLLCSFAVVASASLARADDSCPMKDGAAASHCPMQKKDDKKCEKPATDGACSDGACTKDEKKDEKKSS